MVLPWDSGKTGQGLRSVTQVDASRGNTEPWAEPWGAPWQDPRGYRDAGAEPDPGGEHRVPRRLHKLFTDFG